MIKSNVLKIFIKILSNFVLFAVYASLVGFYAYYLKIANGISESLLVTGFFGTVYLLFILFNKYIGSKIVSQSTVEAINISTLLIWMVIILSTLAFENHLFKGGISLFY